MTVSSATLAELGAMEGPIKMAAPHCITPASCEQCHAPQVATSVPLSGSSRPESQRSVQAKRKRKRKLSDYYKTPARRQQCRTNQARYRSRQREYQAQLEQNVEQLRQEVGDLRRKHRDLSSREPSTESPWSVVAEVFRLVESSFRSSWRTIVRTRGGLRGVDTLLEQLRQFSQYFGNPNLQLVRVDSVAPCVLAARAKLRVTVSELSLKRIFVSEEDEPRRMTHHQHLLDQRLEFSCTMNFLFDEESYRVVRLESTIDPVTALLRALGNLTDVADVLEHAPITPECTVGGGLVVGYRQN
ncbi:hypothetical protein PHYPSEUDO_004089 [Phytophthora pseudosyringae]|uniref:Bzip transcription factor n=1 Tax=Phytophthora pseudosyringae TaxID=221518 RepID=A0A8T1WD04_9STRA|nr:hypothetical protein PHYPSEUDO_004089 [Phytophthora pseudosyringae]